MELVSATSQNIHAAVDCLVSAFVDDKLMLYFFPGEQSRREAAIREFFTILMDVRIELGMPALLLNDGQSPVGAVMGYDLSRPDWPHAQSARFDALVSNWPGLTDRFDAYDAAAKRFEPRDPHFYLGVLGVHPGHQGKGAGRTLIDAYCKLSDETSGSTGTYLETGEADNLGFYQHCGFELMGSAALDPALTLYCLFRPKKLNA